MLLIEKPCVVLTDCDGISHWRSPKTVGFPFSSVARIRATPVQNARIRVDCPAEYEIKTVISNKTVTWRTSQAGDNLGLPSWLIRHQIKIGTTSPICI